MDEIYVSDLSFTSFWACGWIDPRKVRQCHRFHQRHVSLPLFFPVKSVQFWNIDFKLIWIQMGWFQINFINWIRINSGFATIRLMFNFTILGCQNEVSTIQPITSQVVWGFFICIAVLCMIYGIYTSTAWFQKVHCSVIFHYTIRT